ncbi:polysaccharide deacetylase family protein [Novisyntrophococcus fermenticellae]|uniref:polysaccharide deacetylase family protein n=1 Tax=Novisyntrophococcus fermenticellae TaxID=2068655 RepID=UPI001E328756|nr:polysaccharide deacetylase family protein [Novisyntrophococcus fermenticellae]
MDQKSHYSIRKAAFAMFAVLLVASCIVDAVRYLPGTITVSKSTVGERELPIYCVETEKHQVSLTFDLTWGNENTREILDILSARQVKATFFVTGDWVDSYPEEVKRIYEEGHDVGNSSESHRNMIPLTDMQCQQEILSLHNKVKELTGHEMYLFRAPFGDYDNQVIASAKSCGYYSIKWDVDSLDWKDYGVDSIVQTVTQNKHLDNGSIILCHNDAKYTAKALDSLIDNLQKQGYELVPLSQMMYRQSYYIDHEGRQISEEE